MNSQYYAPIGFIFEIEESQNDSIFISPQGFVNFFQNCNANQFGDVVPPILYAYFSAFDDRGWWFGDGETPMTTIHYLTEGEEGNRIFKIEWKNVGFFDSIGEGDDFVNFQVWLYESDNSIEIHFGASFITNTNDEDTWFYFDGPLMAWIYYTDCELTADEPDMLLITGDENNPNHQFVTTEEFVALGIKTIDNAPNKNMVYQFKPTSVDIEEENDFASQLKLYPTIADNNLTLTFSKPIVQEYNIEVYTIEGELLKTQSSNTSNENIDVADLPKGLYLLKVRNQEWNQIFRFIKP
ncbi:MAG: T9SS type A sorting domain-containing protein [Chitinophagales bacterium]